ncbi:unnamed protein product [Caenorhabditis angaria]|uniref:Uncharacterized protein n=1 Tax=Caenorhabditis angaria TaxID=860376 RepID=A0A9P1IEX7_9PELO|nr:unnamed protein product [Caenorhabditis angaria]
MYLQLLFLLQIPLIFCLTPQEEAQPFLTSLAKHLKLQDFTIFHKDYYRTNKDGTKFTRDQVIAGHKMLHNHNPKIHADIYESFKNAGNWKTYWATHIAEKTPEGHLKIKQFKNNKLESYTLGISDAKTEGKYQLLREVYV